MHCPYCRSHDTWRLEPYPWMSRIRPRMRNRRCSNCGHEFAYWCHRFCLRHGFAKKIVFLYQSLLWLLVVCIAVDIYRWTTNPDTSVLHRLLLAIGSLF